MDALGDQCELALPFFRERYIECSGLALKPPSKARDAEFNHQN